MNLYISDLDGTLLNSKQTISNRSLSLINNLIINHDLNFTIATARSLSSAWDIIKNIKLKFPIIYNNGAFIYDPVKNRNIAENIISDHDAGRLIKIIHEYNLNPIVYTVHSGSGQKIYYKGIFNKGEQDYIEDRLSKNDKRFTKTRDYSEICNQKIISINVINTKENTNPLYNYLKDSSGFCYHYGEDIYSKYYWLEINHTRANKRDSVVHLKRSLHIDKIISFGDNLNDVDMFEISDECYAVSNAVDSVKKRATKIIGSNENDGVALYLDSIRDSFKK
jgi:5-amino-6-(5-phospho-D-ribitylamino)uracil phosphatase